jgi:hypothetical protein
VTGQDRRLGDFFTNSIDSRGCVFIASGDTTKPDPVTGGARAIALPIFLRQDSGAALVGGGDCAGETANLGLPGSSSTVGAAGGGNAATGTARSGRRCVSRRHLRIRLRAPAGERLRSARLFVAGKRVTIRSDGRRLRTLRGRRLTLPIDLRGLPKGSFTVRIEAVTASGRRVVDLRRYRTCRAKGTARGRASSRAYALSVAG